MVRHQQQDMDKIKSIMCLGNNTQETAIRAAEIAEEYSLPLNGLAQQIKMLRPGCWYSDIGTISMDKFLQWISSIDLVVLLDQPENSYQHAGSYRNALLMCSHLQHFRPVIIENQNPDVYIVTHYETANTFNKTIYRVRSTQELETQLMVTDIKNKTVVLQLSRLVNESELDQYKAQIDRIVDHCRQHNAKFIMIRADQHESDDVHFEITKYLVQFPEFVLLTDRVFKNNLNLNLDKKIFQHLALLYHR